MTVTLGRGEGVVLLLGMKVLDRIYISAKLHYKLKQLT